MRLDPDAADPSPLTANKPRLSPHPVIELCNLILTMSDAWPSTSNMYVKP